MTHATSNSFVFSRYGRSTRWLDVTRRAAGAAIAAVVFMATLGTKPATAQSVFDGMPNWLADQGRLLATAGVLQIEGAAGAGLTPWAVITGYGTRDAVGANVHHTFASTSDFTLNSSGVAVGLFNRVELSYARQWFDTGTAGARLGLGDGYDFSQDVFGAKVRISGNLVYDQDTWMPQLAAGVQYKNAEQEDVLAALGAEDDDGVDYYIAATKLFLEHGLLLNLTARATQANQFGLLGFGGPEQDGYQLELESSVAYLLSRNIVLGSDYRTKPDQLAFAPEEDAAAIYGAWLPNKTFSVTAGYVALGDIALQGEQNGIYLSIAAGF